jgi:uncharacterized membrane protein YcfT
MNKQRITWVDYAKGICIVAVVTFYVTTHVEDILQAHGWMHRVIVFAQPFRMPDFFLLSGLFVAPVLGRPLRAYLDTKVLHFLYFYVLWITLRFVLQDGSALLGSGAPAALRGFLTLFIQPHGQLWFIYLLPAFFLTVRVLRSLPPALVLLLAVGLKLAEFNTGWKLIDRYTMYFIYFYAGYVFAPQIFALAAWAQDHRRQACALLAGWFAAHLLIVLKGWAYLPGMPLALGFAGATAVLIASSLLCGIAWMHWLRYLGQHSLVVYLGFVVPMALMRKLLTAQHVVSDPGTISLGVIVGSIAGAILMYWAVRHTPLRFLFARPRWLQLDRSSAGLKAKRARLAPYS